MNISFFALTGRCGLGGVFCRAGRVRSLGGLGGVVCRAGRGRLPSYADIGILRHYFHKHADSAYIGRHIHGKYPEE